MKLKGSNELRESLVQIVRNAHREILEVYATPFDVDRKGDSTPVTEADLRAHNVILEGLSKLTPKLPIISEEYDIPPFEERREWDQYWIVDPLDGTKEFVKKSGEFTVNIALVEKNRPVIGVASIPVSGDVYYGDTQEGIALRLSNDEETEIQARLLTANSVVAMRNRRRGNANGHTFVKKLSKFVGPIEEIGCGSSMKSLRVAEGAADMCVQAGVTNEWDTAAVDAILTAAGGSIVKDNLQPIDYNASYSLANPAFIALGKVDPTTRERIHELFKETFYQPT